MIERKDLKSYITDDILNELFFNRKNKIHELEEKERMDAFLQECIMH